MTGYPRLIRFIGTAVLLAAASGLVPTIASTASQAASTLAVNQAPGSLPRLRLPDDKIVEVYQGNWEHTLLPCRTLPTPAPGTSPHAEPERPWKVDVRGHYPGWYPGVDVKHLAAAYLACEKNLPLVLRAWDLTVGRYLMEDGAVRPMTMYHNPHSVVPEATLDGSIVYYPLRTTANIDLLLLGDMIFRFSQDRAWLERNLAPMRRAAAFLEAWIDEEGLLDSDSYDLDQVYRQIDGVAQASAHLAFRRLATLESIGGHRGRARHANAVADRLAEAANRHFWDPQVGDYAEHLTYHNIARTGQGSDGVLVSSELDSAHGGARAVDGVLGIGIDAFDVKTGAAGSHEWAARHETVGAWIQVSFSSPTRVGKAILVNRTDPQVQPGERFAAGYLEFSDGSRRVPVSFSPLAISRAAVAFSPRTVRWIRFTGTRMQGEVGHHAGLAEFMVLPVDRPYRQVRHGMTDSSLAMVAFGVAGRSRAEQVWRRFQQHEPGFYEVNGLAAPTWVSSEATRYGPGDLNRRAPYKDCVAMGRTWRYDVLMRRRFQDGIGIVRTLGYANTLYDRPSGGGVGLFAERYGLGRFQPGDEAQATIAAYAEYPAVYNAIVVQQALLGLEVEADGTVIVNPCVPRSWYGSRFGADHCGLLHERDFGFTFGPDHVEGWAAGPAGLQRLMIRIPPELDSRRVVVESRGERLPHQQRAGFVKFALPLLNGERVAFDVKAATRTAGR